MEAMWAFANEHHIVALLMVWAICSLLKAPFYYAFKAWNRTLRSRNIAAHGWPTAPVDADGDVVYEKEKQP